MSLYKLPVVAAVLTGVAVFAAPVFAAPVFAAPPGVSAPSFQLGNSSPPPTTFTDAGVAELFLKIQELEQEVQLLRGTVEEQAYTIEIMKKQQRERYLDLDRRLSELYRNAPATAPPATAPNAASSSSASEPAAVTTTPATNADTSSTESKQAYQAAYQLIRDKKYEQAIDALHGFINQYPQDELTGNAYYWLGEVYLVLPKLEQAKQAFTVVVSRYGSHRKAPDANFKLATVYDRLGDPDKARDLLNAVITRFPGSSAATLANEYLQRLP